MKTISLSPDTLAILTSIEGLRTAIIAAGILSHSPDTSPDDVADRAVCLHMALKEAELENNS